MDLPVSHLLAIGEAARTLAQQSANDLDEYRRPTSRSRVVTLPDGTKASVVVRVWRPPTAPPPKP